MAPNPKVVGSVKFRASKMVEAERRRSLNLNDSFVRPLSPAHAEMYARLRLAKAGINVGPNVNLKSC